MPAAGADQQRGGLVIQLVTLAFGAGIFDGPVHRVAQIDVAIEVVRPGGRIGVFEISHENVRAAVEGVDDHFPVDRPGDFYAAIHQVLRNGSDAPFLLTDRGGLGKKIRKLSGLDLGLANAPALEELLATRFEFVREAAEEAQGFFGEDAGVRLAEGRGYLKW